MESRSLGWTPISVLGPMGRTVADTRQLFAAQIGMNDGEPLTFPLEPELVAAGRPADLGRLRVAWTQDFGQCPVSREIRAVMRERIAAMRHLFRVCEEVTLDFGEADRCFDVVRALNFVARHHATYRKDPSLLGPNVRANYEMGATMSFADAAWAEAEQTRIFRRFQALFRDYDVVLSPTTPVSPRPWLELYLPEMNPAVSLPCGRDHASLPFGLQVTGRFRGDLALLAVAQAMEEAFARIPGLERPRPDRAKLARMSADLKSLVTHPPMATAASCKQE
jgi:Asp-tRNA(Asn)/Glu-tRNA(Gln) amidotransferase A subunit family amidase